MESNGARLFPKGRRALRLLEFSPLGAIAFLVSLALIVPPALMIELIQAQSFRLSSEDIAQRFSEQPVARVHEWFQRVDDPNGIRAGESLERPEPALRNLLDAGFPTSEVDRDHALDASGSPRPYSLGPSTEVADRYRALERRFGGRVYLYALTDPGTPSVVASAVGDPDIEPTSAELASVDATLGVDTFGYAWRRHVSMSTLFGYRPNLVERRQGAPGFAFPLSGSGDDRGMVWEVSPIIDGRVYELLLISHDKSGEGIHPGLPEELMVGEPGSKEYQRKTAEFARQYGLNVYVAGPLDVGPVPLNHKDEAVSPEELAAAAWPHGFTNQGDEILRVPDEYREALGGAEWWLPLIASSGGSPQYPYTMLAVALWDEDPVLHPPLPAETVPALWRRIQIALALHSPWLLALGLVLLTASLVASPAAFLLERRRETERRVLEQMQRVQRDAHDTVYNRLSALSKRVAMASEGIEADVQTGLNAIAEDIRGTVGDLQRILGETPSGERSHVSGVGGDVLVTQLQAVADAQAARLGVRVELTIPRPLPTLSPQLGWDLQCVLEEAITNAVKHGGAHVVRAEAAEQAGGTRLTVRDDGSGVAHGDIDAIPESSTGLRGVRERLGKWGGTVAIGPAEDGGTLLVVEVPPQRQ